MYETAKKIISDDYKCGYLECSSATGEGVKEVFEEAMRLVVKRKIKPAVRKKK